jgi:asparagine synthase (glutamine-hydrolysing)
MELAKAGKCMADSLRHRGPDGQGVWTEEDAGLCLAHRRLSILDLSVEGAQPMVSASGRFVISYNGETYNHAELRSELEAKGHRFRGHSDTEVIVEAIDEWGIDATVKRLIGMFAIAVWDRTKRILTLVRDRMGIKPLYWGQVAGAFAFGSELKALRALPGWQGEIDRDALTAYMRYCYIPDPHSIYRNVSKLEPGCILEVDVEGQVKQRRYWDTRALMAEATRTRIALSDSDATNHLDGLLRDAVARRMVADVPVGAFLSGGIDSSLVVALMQAVSGQPVHTFSIGFEERDYDEGPYAAAVAKYLGTHHTELIVTPRQAIDVIPDLPRWYDEPFADSSQIPTFLVSQLARRNVAVALSGDGGDELFAGYTRYFTAQSMWQPLKGMPAGLRKAVPAAIGALSPRQWDILARLVPDRWRPPHFGQRLYKLKGALTVSGPNDFYRPLLTHWSAPEDLVVGGREPPHILDDYGLAGEIPDMVERMQMIDMLTYLPGDILAKVDRASMAVGLEVRVPIIDHRVVEFTSSLPSHQRVRDGRGKWLLRQVLDRYVPSTLIDRPKMGFGVPVDTWLRGPLRDWAEDLLDPTRLQAEGFLDPTQVREKWTQHLDGKCNWQYLLWDVLMFQAWKQYTYADSAS